jgi:hypothetical protein
VRRAEHAFLGLLVAGCAGALHRASLRGAWCKGPRACRGRLTGARVALPATLAALSPVQRGALLAMSLASERAPRAHHRAPGDMSVGSAPPNTSRP